LQQFATAPRGEKEIFCFLDLEIQTIFFRKSRISSGFFVKRIFRFSGRFFMKFTASLNRLNEIRTYFEKNSEWKIKHSVCFLSRALQDANNTSTAALRACGYVFLKRLINEL